MKDIKIKKLKVVDFSEVGFDWDLCDEMYEGGCGESVVGRMIDVEFWKIMFEDWIEEGWGKDRNNDIKMMLNNIKDLDDDVMIGF